MQLVFEYFRGIGQIMLQPSAITGVFFLGGIALMNEYQAQMLMLAAAVGLAYGRYASASNIEWQRDGLFVFNAALTGLTISVTFVPGITSAICLVAGVLLSCALMHVFLNRGWPAYTAPFVITSWILIGFRKVAGLAIPSPYFPQRIVGDLPFAPFLGVGQIMFQLEVVSGLMFLLGMMFSHAARTGVATGRRDSLLATVCVFGGSLIGGVTGWLLGASNVLIAKGLFGYNAALTALGVYQLRRNVPQALIFASLTVPVQMSLYALEIPAFTAPFVIITWLAYSLRRSELAP